MKHNLLFGLIAGLSLTLGACSLGGVDSSITPFGGNSSGDAPVFGQSSSSSENKTSSESIIYYTVTFMVDGDVYETQSVREKAKASRPVDPYKPGYEFLFWTEDYRYEWNFDTNRIRNDVTLYALFAENTSSQAQDEIIAARLMILYKGWTEEIVCANSVTPESSDQIKFWKDVELREGDSFAIDVEFKSGSVTRYGYSSVKPGSIAFDYFMKGDGEYLFCYNGGMFNIAIYKYSFEIDAIMMSDLPDYSSEGSYSSQGEQSSADFVPKEAYLIGKFTDGQPLAQYQRNFENGFPLVWENIQVSANDYFWIRVVDADGNIEERGWWFLDDGGQYSGVLECESDAIPSIRAKYNGYISLSLGENRLISMTYWSETTPAQSSYEQSSSGESSSYEQSSSYGESSYSGYESTSSPSGRRVYLIGTMTSWQQKDEYCRYASDGYPMVWSDISFDIYDEFRIFVAEESGVANYYDWASLTAECISCGYFGNGTGGIQSLYGGTYTISYDERGQISIDGWQSQPISSDGSAYSSSEGSYDSSEYSSQAGMSHVNLVCGFRVQTPTSMSKEGSEGYPYEWKDVYFDSMDYFSLEIIYADMSSSQLGYWNLDVEGRASSYIACESDAVPSIRAMESGYYSIYFYENQEIHVDYTPVASSSEYSSSDEGSYSSSEEPTSTYEDPDDSYEYIPPEFVRAWMWQGYNDQEPPMTEGIADETYYGTWSNVEVYEDQCFYFVVEYEGPSQSYFYYSSLSTSCTGASNFVEGPGTRLRATGDGIFNFHIDRNCVITIDYVGPIESSSSSEAPTLISSTLRTVTESLPHDHEFPTTDFDGVNKYGVWYGIELRLGDMFCIELTYSDGNVYTYGYDSMGADSMAADLFADSDSNHLVCQKDGIYDIVLEYSSDGPKIFITYVRDITSSSESSSSAIAPGYYLIGSFTEWVISEAYRGNDNTGDTYRLAEWLNVTLNVEETFKIVLVDDAGDMTWYGYDLINACESYSCFSEGNDDSFLTTTTNTYNIRFLSSGYIDISPAE